MFCFNIGYGASHKCAVFESQKFGLTYLLTATAGSALCPAARGVGDRPNESIRCCLKEHPYLPHMGPLRLPPARLFHPWGPKPQSRLARQETATLST